jgi:lysozyme
MSVSEFPFGIDVSNNNGGVNWPAVAAAGVQFAIAKASEGVGFVDSFLASNFAGMQANGILRGAYHFGRPSQSGPQAEADFFVDTLMAQLGDLAVGDIVALDLEDPAAGGDLSDWTLTWVQRVESRLGFKPLVYTSPSYIQEHHLANRPELADYGLWLASWGVPTPPPAPAPWELVAIHQYEVGPSGSVPGVVGEIDLDRFNGPRDRIALYGRPGTATDPTTPPTPEFIVGAGILARMGALGDRPASDEAFLTQQWSEAVAKSGRVYRYVADTGRVHVFEPSA